MLLVVELSALADFSRVQSAFALDLAMHNVRIHLHYYVQLDKVKGNSQ